MLIITCLVLMLMIFGYVLSFGLRMAWHMTKIICSVFFLPVILIGLLIAGFSFVVLPILIVIGAFVLIKALIA